MAASSIRLALLLGFAVSASWPGIATSEESKFDADFPPPNAIGGTLSIVYSKIDALNFSTVTPIYRSQMQELSAAKTKIEEDQDQIVIELRSDALFDFDKSDIRPDAGKVLQEALAVIKKHRGMSINLGGHTDAKGSDDYNVKLSESRANSVRDWLAKNGIVTSSMRVTGYGESRPRAANIRPDGTDWPESRALNRRVEIVLRKQ